MGAHVSSILNPPPTFLPTPDLGCPRAAALPLQCSCLENPLDRGAWRATVHEVAKLDMTEISCHSTISAVTGFDMKQ